MGRRETKEAETKRGRDREGQYKISGCEEGRETKEERTKSDEDRGVRYWLDGGDEAMDAK